MSFLLGCVSLGFLILLLVGKILTVLELRSQDQECRRNQRRIAELEEALDTSRRKYLIALKAEGVAKQKQAHLKTRLANMKQHLEQIEVTAAQQKARQQQDLEHTLEVLVMKALGGPSARRDSHFKRVMRVIKELIDLEAEGNSDEVIAVVQKKLAEMGRTGMLQGEEEGRAAGADRPRERRGRIAAAPETSGQAGGTGGTGDGDKPSDAAPSGGMPGKKDAARTADGGTAG